MNEEKAELEKAIELVQKNGYGVIHQLSLAARPYIRELSDVIEAAGYRLDEAKVERDGGRATGRIFLTVFPLKILEKLEQEGRA
jgi:hypothetical protein